ncbi:MAG: hypothetical protein JWQ48_1634 [Conexibacter sp.]|nr:hypothetical protein [Conexibacter sp.]
MSALVRLAGFAAALALLFGAALAVGGVIGPDRDRSAKADNSGQPSAGAHGMTGMSATDGDAHGGGAMAAQPVRGLAVSDNGLTLKLARTSAQPGKPFDLAFRILGRDGQTVRDFDVERTKRMHLIVVRRDMTGFQHLHPIEAADGTWSVPVTLREAGSYRFFADFSVAGKPRTLADDVAVDGSVRSAELPAPVKSAEVDGLRVGLTESASHAGGPSGLAFGVTRGGTPVAVQDYLGAKGHLVALREGDLAFLHVHPDEDSLKFMAAFPTAGRYRLFLQFQVDGKVHTAAFTQEVAR